jgi:hypothetical protein
MVRFGTIAAVAHMADANSNRDENIPEQYKSVPNRGAILRLIELLTTQGYCPAH